MGDETNRRSLRMFLNRRLPAPQSPDRDCCAAIRIIAFVLLSVDPSDAGCVDDASQTSRPVPFAIRFGLSDSRNSGAVLCLLQYNHRVPFVVPVIRG